MCAAAKHDRLVLQRRSLSPPDRARTHRSWCARARARRGGRSRPPPAVPFAPRVTASVWRLAVLVWPPVTELNRPEATLLTPPVIAASPPVAVPVWPPLTLSTPVLGQAWNSAVAPPATLSQPALT